MEEDLIIDALQKAFDYRKPMAGLIVHSDRGGQYVANNFKKLLDKYECKQSMNCVKKQGSKGKKVLGTQIKFGFSPQLG